MQTNYDQHDQIGDYSYNKKTKEYSLNKNGKMKVDNIAKGILKDGINFREENNIIDVNGEGQPKEQDLIHFIVDYSDNVEVSGYGLNDAGPLSENVSAMLVWQHKENEWDKAIDIAYNKDRPIPISWRGRLYKGKSRFAKYHYHIHQKIGQYKGGDINTPSEEDYKHSSKAKLPHFIFNINGIYPY